VGGFVDYTKNYIYNKNEINMKLRICELM